MFVTPPPEGSERAPGDNPIWSATLPVLHAGHIAIADVAPAVSGTDGGRVESIRDCRGNDVRCASPRRCTTRASAQAEPAPCWPMQSPRSYTAIAMATPRPATTRSRSVPTVTGNGYWLVQCDGSVFHFGDAAAVSGVSGTVDEPIVAAVRAAGLWLVARSQRALSRRWAAHR